MKRLMNLLMLSTMLFVFVQPEKQPTLGRSIRDQHRVSSRSQRTVGIAQEEAGTLDGWVIEEVDCPNINFDMTNRSLHLDASGYPHIVYGDENLYYASYNGVSWHIETVDVVHALRFYSPSLEIDGDGYPHISYISSHSVGEPIKYIYLLKYVYLDSAGWHTRTVDEVQWDTSMSFVLDGNGYPHIIYTAPMKYAYQDGSGWHSEWVYAYAIEEIVDISLALTGDGYPHISYTDYIVPTPHGDTYILRYVYQDPAGWNNQRVDEGWSSSISLDGNGYPHISYNGSLKYAYRDDVGWYIQEFGDCCSTGGSSIALDGDGYPHISYPTFGDFEGLKYTYKDTAGWHIRLVVSEIGDSSSTSLVLDKDEFPHTYL